MTAFPHAPVSAPSKFTGQPRLRPAALPAAGRPRYVVDPRFPRVRYPFAACTRQAIGMAIKEGRLA